MNNLNPQMVGGMKVVISRPHQVQVKRTWKERLFTRPWTPMQTHRTELHEIIPGGEIIFDRINQVIYCNEKMYQKIMKLEAKNAKDCD